MAISDFEPKAGECWHTCNCNRVAKDVYHMNKPDIREGDDGTLVFQRETVFRISKNSNSRMFPNFDLSNNMLYLEFISDHTKVNDILPQITSACLMNNAALIFIPSTQHTDAKSQKLDQTLNKVYRELFEYELDRTNIESDHRKDMPYYLFCAETYPYIETLMKFANPLSGKE